MKVPNIVDAPTWSICLSTLLVTAESHIYQSAMKKTILVKCIRVLASCGGLLCVVLYLLQSILHSPPSPSSSQLTRNERAKSTPPAFFTKSTRPNDNFEALIILTLIRHDLLDLQLRSIDHPVDHVFVVMNYASEGAKQQTVNTLKNYEHCGNMSITNTSCVNRNINELVLLAKPVNVGVSGSMNVGLKAMIEFNLRYAIFNGDDTRFRPGRLLDAKHLISSSRDVCVFLLEGYASHAVTREGARRIGPWDENFWPAYAEDCDIWFRTLLQGCKIYYRGGYRPIGSSAESLRRAFVDHGDVSNPDGSATHKSFPQLASLVERTLDSQRGRFAYLVRKWGVEVCSLYHQVLHQWRDHDAVLEASVTLLPFSHQNYFLAPYNDSINFSDRRRWLANDWKLPGAVSSRAVNSEFAPAELVWQDRDYISL